jgi:hypothetical protein
MKKIFYGMCGTAAVALAVLVCGACKGSYLDPSIADYNNGGGSGGGGGGGAGAGESDLYFTGALFRMNGAEPELINYCYWHDGTETPLQASLDSGVRNEVLYRGNLYQCGYYRNGDTNSPCYWINGVRTELTRFTESGWEEAIGIIVVNGRIHIAGKTGGQTLCYWIDGDKQNLSLSNLPSAEGFWLSLEGIATDGENVYIMGEYHYYNYEDNTYMYFYFSPADGGNITTFLSTSSSIILEKIYVANGDVYIIMWEANNKRYYYVNGRNKTPISVPAVSSGVVEDVIVLNNTVHAVGYTHDGANYSSIRACYWKNGVQKQLSDKMSAASSIGIWNN